MRPGEGVAQDSLQEMMASEDNIAESWALDPPADRVAVIGLRACTTARQCSAVVLPHQPRPLDLCRTARLCRSCNLSCLTTWTRRTCARSHSRTPSTCCAQVGSLGASARSLRVTFAMAHGLQLSPALPIPQSPPPSCSREARRVTTTLGRHIPRPSFVFTFRLYIHS